MQRLSYIDPPTQDEFSEFKRLAIRPGSQAILEFKEGRPERHWISAFGTDVEDLLVRIDEAAEECSKTLHESAVGRWFFAHPTSDRAWAAAHRSSKRDPVREPASVRALQIVEACYQQRTVEDILRVKHLAKRKEWEEAPPTPQELDGLLEIENSAERRQRRLERHLEWLASYDRFGVGRGVAAAFEDYFYGSSFTKHAIKPAEVRKRAAELLNAIAVLNDEARWEAIGMKPIMVGGYHRTGIAQLRDREANPRISPIKKLDETAPDRFLAYSLWRVFQKAYRSNRTTAIYNFMQFSGVKNAPDARSVERWVQDWHGDAKAKREADANSV